MTAGPKAPPIADEVQALVQAALTPPSVFDRFTGRDGRVDAVSALAHAGEYRIVPALLPLLASGGAVASETARTIAALARESDPARLAWLDAQARPGHVPGREAWTGLTPFRATWIARQHLDEPEAIGLLACHQNGFVRAAALQVLDDVTDGREIPFLALRANDWVRPVADAAASMLRRRLVPDNRAAVVTALPFLIRLFQQRRRDLAGSLGDPLRDVLLSDGGRAVLSAVGTFPRVVGRTVFEIVASSSETPNAAVLDAALANVDAAVRLTAVRWLGSDTDASRSIELLDRMASTDPVPSVRRAALTLLAQGAPASVARKLPAFLMDRSAGVRSLARFLARQGGAPIVVRQFYAERLADASSVRQLAAALDGIGETGTAEEAPLAAARLGHPAPAVRCAALRALTDLAAEEGVSAALAALDDPASSVHATAVSILRRHVRSVDAETLRLRARASGDPRRRLRTLALLASASKWDAAVSLVEALQDPDAAVRARAAQLLRAWHPAFLRSFVEPRPVHVRRLQALLDGGGGSVPDDIASAVRFVLKTAHVSSSPQ